MILKLMFPSTCLACGRVGKTICHNCKPRDELKQSCPNCGRANNAGIICPNCHDGNNHIEALLTLLPADRADLHLKLIKEFKYRGQKKLMKYFVKALRELASFDLLSRDDWVLCPVPLFKAKQKARGFNQSELLSKAFAKLLGKTMIDPLIKTRNTISQTGLSREQRYLNVQDAFAIKAEFRDSLPANVLLVDDVFTSGASTQNCAKVLKNNGAKKVWVLSLLRNI